MDCIVHRVARSPTRLSLSQVGFAWRLAYRRYPTNIVVLFLYILFFLTMDIQIERSLRKFLLTECMEIAKMSK